MNQNKQSRQVILNFRFKAKTMRRNAVRLACSAQLFLLLLGYGIRPAAAETYFGEDFDGPLAPVPKCWWTAPLLGEGHACLTEEKAFSGKRSALIEAGTSYWEIFLPKLLKWDRKDPAGIGNRPLYLSMRVFTASAGANADIGFRASIVPKRHPGSGGAPVGDYEQTNVAGRTNEWLLLCLDFGKAQRDTETQGTGNPDHIVLESVAFFVRSGGKFYLDDIRLSTERPEGCSPPPPAPPKINAKSFFRPDPKLEGMVLHGIYGGLGSLNEDCELHADTIRDLKRHYVNFVYGIDYRVTCAEPRLRAVERALDQAAEYDMLYLPTSYIGDRYTAEAQAWGSEKLRSGMQRIVRRFRDKSHLLGWYLEEEFGLARAPAALEQKRWVEEVDPQHSVWSILSAGPSVQSLGPAYAVVIPDDYPIMGPSCANPWIVPHRIAQDMRTLKQPYLLTDQIFAGGCGWTVPTLGQWRLMVYGAMAEGGRGFFHFLYQGGPLYRQREGERLHGGMVNPYGIPSAIHDEIERHLGPDLFSVGELLRTCHPATMPSEIRIKCGTVENYLEKEILAIAARRLVDAKGSYEILALYSNDPNGVQSGTLHLPAAWIGNRIVMDLSAHSHKILEQSPILVKGETMTVQLEPGDGRFLAVAKKSDAPKLIERMQSRRFEALRKMVEFDCRWLARIGVGKPYSAHQWTDLQQICDRKSPRKALQKILQIEKTNQNRLKEGDLAQVLRDLAVIRTHLSTADVAIEQWAIPSKGSPFPPDVNLGKSYCLIQDKLSELFVGYGDLVYTCPPASLVGFGTELAAVCERHAKHLQKVSTKGVPAEPCPLTLATLKPFDDKLAALGWKRPPTNLELWKQR